MRLLRLDPNKVNLGKKYVHKSGRMFTAFMFVNMPEGLGVKLIEDIPNEPLPTNRYMNVDDFQLRLRKGEFSLQV